MQSFSTHKKVVVDGVENCGNLVQPKNKPQYVLFRRVNSGFEYRFEFAEKFNSIVVVELNRISQRIRICSIFKTALAHESGDPEVPLNAKTRVENLVILSL
jgi:hypothetical protein